MKMRLVIKDNDKNESSSYRTVDLWLADSLMDTEHEHVVGVEVEPEGFGKPKSTRERK